MANVNVSQRLYWLSRLAESAYGTARAYGAGPPKTHRKLICTDKAMGNYSVNTADNKGHSTGVDWPTEQYIESHDFQVSHSEQVNSQDVGRRLYQALGSVTTTQPAAGPSPTVYQHVFVPQDANTSRQLPSYDYGEIIGSNHDVQYPACVMEKLSIKGDGKGRLTMDWSLRGSGKRTTPSGATYATHVDELTGTLVYLFNSQIVLGVDDGVTPINYACRYNNFMVDIDNQLLADDGYRPGCALFQTAEKTSGLVRGECLFGERNISSEFEVRLASGGVEYAALQAQTPLIITITAEAGIIEDAYTHKLIISIPVARYETVEMSDVNGIVTLKIKPKPMYSVSTGKIIEFTLTNDVASYTA